MQSYVLSNAYCFPMGAYNFSLVCAMCKFFTKKELPAFSCVCEAIMFQYVVSYGASCLIVVRGSKHFLYAKSFRIDTCL